MSKELEKELVADVLKKRLDEPTFQGRISLVVDYLTEKKMKIWSRGSINNVMRYPDKITITKKNRQLVEVIIHLSELHGWETGSFKK